MIVYVYILEGFNGAPYTGITKNINKRIKEHNSGQNKSTAKIRPLKLIWFCKAVGYKQARRIEKKIKNMGAFKFLAKDNARSLYRRIASSQISKSDIIKVSL